MIAPDVRLARAANRRPMRRTAAGERGTSVIEFALASIVFFMTIFGLVEFGRAIFQYSVVASLAKEGARYAALHGSTTSSPASSGDVATYVQARALGMTPTVTATWPDAGTPSNKPGNRVQVVVQQTFTPLTVFIPFSTLTLRSTAQLVIAR